MSISIVESVGRRGKNREADTLQIQLAFNVIFPTRPLVVDGDCGRKTIAAIERFQRRFMGQPDGRIDPGGRSLRRLNSSLPWPQSGRTAPARPAPSSQPVPAAPPEEQGDWSGDSSRWPQAKKMASLDHRMRPKVRRVLAALREEGYKPKIVFAWRSVAVQRELVRKRRSKVLFSFHNAQHPDGTPNAYAVDIIDRRWAWSDEAEENGFWAALGRAAKKERMYWGGDWVSFKDWAHIQFWQNNELGQIKRESGLA